jgi:uncharacterized protein YecE (DUF72 family)
MMSLGIAYVDADPPIVQRSASNSSGSIHYIRLHGSPIIYHSPYSESYIDQLARRLSGAYALGRQCWCVFDNTASGAAVDNAYSLLLKLRSAQSAQTGAIGES